MRVLRGAGVAAGAAIALLALGAGPAAAGTVSAQGSGGTPGHIVVTFQADPGEANRVTYSDDDGGIVVADSGAPLAAGAGCDQLDSSRARGARGEIAAAVVQLGDRDDAVAIGVADARFFAQLFGDAGDDSLTGGAGADNFNLEPGDDVVVGGGGHDSFGATASSGVTITLDGVANDGEAGERDNIDADLILASDGPDTLIGGDRSDDFHGRGGDDRLVGNGGADQLRGGDGADALDGGAGTDLLLDHEATPAVDSFLCGPDFDNVNAGEGDSYADDCERVHVGAQQVRPPTNGAGPPPVGFLVSALAPLDRRRVELRVGCNDPTGRLCRGTVRLADRRGRRLGARAFSGRAGRVTKVRVKVASRARDGQVARVRIAARDSVGRRTVDTARVRLR